MQIGDYVVHGVSGEFFASTPESFEANNIHVSGNVYRKNASGVVTVVLFTGDNFAQIVDFTSFDPERMAKDFNHADKTCLIPRSGREPYICHAGNYVIRNGGSVYPCEAEIFAQTYEPVGGEPKQLVATQKGNKLNQVFAMDERGSGGAKHHYQIVRGDTVLAAIKFQCGPRNAPDSVPGVADEDLLEIVRDRLTDFQNGAFASQYNADALNHITAALMVLDARAQDRAERGVLGKDKA